MNKKIWNKKNLSKPQNLLSLSRIPLSAFLVAAVFINRWVYLTILIIIGLTDFLDGIVARARKESSPQGAWFDSMADHVFYPVLFLTTYLLTPWIFLAYWLPVILICLIWIINVIIMYTRCKRFIFVHLQSVRISVTVFFIFTILVIFNYFVEWAFLLTLVVFSIRLAEEFFVFNRMSKKNPNPDLRYFWQLNSQHHNRKK